MHYTVFAKPIPPISVETIKDDIELSMYPSETSTFVNIQSDNLFSDGVKLNVFNSIGEIVFAQDGFISNRFKINVSNFPSGMYYVTLSNSVSRISKQFIVIK